jgi:hypothetical protein
MKMSPLDAFTKLVDIKKTQFYQINKTNILTELTEHKQEHNMILESWDRYTNVAGLNWLKYNIQYCHIETKE